MVIALGKGKSTRKASASKREQQPGQKNQRSWVKHKNVLYISEYCRVSVGGCARYGSVLKGAATKAGKRLPLKSIKAPCP